MENEANPAPAQEPKPQGDQSGILGVSIRAWLAVILTLTVCSMSLFGIEVKEPLYTLVGMALGWYYGQKEKK